MSGELCLGIVSSCLKRGWLIDLSAGRRGFLGIDDAIDESICESSYKPKFAIGDFVVAAVKQDSGTAPTRLLTIKPSEMNRNISWSTLPVKNQLLMVGVTCVEEHGWFGSLGTLSSKHNIKIFVKDESDGIIPGMIKPVLLSSIKKESNLFVCSTNLNRFLNFNSLIDAARLLPGQVVECRTLEVHSRTTNVVDEDGIPRKKRKPMAEQQTEYSKLMLLDTARIDVLFCTSINGQIAIVDAHNPYITEPKDIENAFACSRFPYITAGKKLEGLAYAPRFEDYRSKSFFARIARIVTSADGPDKIYLSTLPHVIALRLNSEWLDSLEKSVSPGSVIENCNIIGRVEKQGLYLAGPADSALIYVNKTNVAVKTPEFVIASTPINSKHKIRAFRINLFSGICTGSMLDVLTDTKSLAYASDFEVGDLVKAKITGSEDAYVNVTIGEQFKSRILATHLLDSAISSVPNGKFKVGEILKARVLSVDYNKNRILLSSKPSYVKMTPTELAEHKKPFSIGSIRIFTVSRHLTNGILVATLNDGVAMISYADLARSTIDGFDDIGDKPISEGLKKKLHEMKKYAVGAVVKAKITREVDDIHTGGKKIYFATTALDGELSRLIPATTAEFRYDESLPITELVASALEYAPIGTIVAAKVSYVSRAEPCVYVEIQGKLKAEVHALHICANPKDGDLLLDTVVKGDTMNVAIIGAHENPNASAGTLLRAALATLPTEVRDLHRTLSFDTIQCGDIVDGVVRNASLNGLLIDIGSSLTARLIFSEIRGYGFDEFIKTRPDGKVTLEGLRTLFPRGKFIAKIRVTNVDKVLRRISVSLKTSTTWNSTSEVNWDNLVVGAVLPANVKGVYNFGMILRLANSCPIDALCPTMEIRDEGDEEVTYERGDCVLCKVISFKKDRQRVIVGVKPSLFNGLLNDDLAEEVEIGSKRSAAEPVATVDSEEEYLSDSENELDAEDNEHISALLSSDEDEDENENESENENEVGSEGAISKDNDSVTCASKDICDSPGAEDYATPSSHISISDSENEIDILSELDISDNEDVLDTSATNINKNIKTSLKDVKAADIDAHANKSRSQSINDLEMRVVTEGDGAGIWIELMAYHMETNDIDAALDIGRSGIDKIPFEASEDRLILWQAIINAAVDSDKTDEVVTAYIMEAARYCDSDLIYVHALNTIAEYSRFSLVPTLKPVVLKKQANPDVWNSYLTCIYKKLQSNGDSNRDTVREAKINARNALSKTSCLRVDLHCARSEFAYGSEELGRSSFLEILSEHKKRVDIWQNFIALQLRTIKRKNDIEITRSLFRRTLDSGIKPVKLKPILELWLKFETKYGSTASAKSCHELITKFVGQA